MRLHRELLTSTRLPGLVLSNGHLGVRGNGNGHDHRGHGGNGHVKRVMKWSKPHVKDGRNQAACRALGAVMLIMNSGFTVQEAIACTGSCADYIAAMKWVLLNGDQDLLSRVLHDQVDLFDAAAQVRRVVELKTAIRAAKAVNPAGAADVLKDPEVKGFIAAAGVVTAEEHFVAAVDAFTVDGTLNLLAAMEQGAKEPVITDAA